MQEAPKPEKTATKALQAQQQEKAITSATAKIRAQLHKVTIQASGVITYFKYREARTYGFKLPWQPVGISEDIFRSFRVSKEG